MKLLKLKLENFKGISKFEFEPNGYNVDIYGDNATGKTTVFDAFLWLLFDKESSNRKDFNIKNIDKSGEPSHHLEHSVTGIFLIDTKMVTLEKIFKEKWVRNRGQAVEKFSGHTTEYIVNGVPVKKTEYDQTIKGIADEKVFRLVTDPLFANEQLSWQELRDIVLDVCGNVSDEEVCSDKTLAPLLAYLNEGKSIDDMKKVIQSKQRKINDDLKIIPAKISELANMKPPSGNTEEEFSAIIDKLKKSIAEKNERISTIKNGGAVSGWKLQIAELRVKEKEEQSEINKETTKKREAIKDQINTMEIKKVNLCTDLRNTNYSISGHKATIDGEEKNLVSLREQATAALERQFEHKEITCTCPLCNQDLPEEQVQAAKDKLEKMREAFNLKKSEEVTDINTKGKALKAKIENNKAELEKLVSQSETYTADINTITEKIEAVQAKLNEIKDIDDSDKLAKIRSEISELENKIKSESESSESEISTIKIEIAGLESEIETHQEDIAAIRQYAKTQDRIAELKKQQEDLAREYEELSGMLFLTETFTRRKVEMLEQKINEKFKLARFKMYAENITNEGIAECCETTMDGVPYKDLNNAAKINVGLDIIQTLSGHYDFKAPIFVDNAEAVTKLLDIDAQIVRLVVSEADKKLRVEVKE